MRRRSTTFSLKKKTDKPINVYLCVLVEYLADAKESHYADVKSWQSAAANNWHLDAISYKTGTPICTCGGSIHPSRSLLAQKSDNLGDVIHSTNTGRSWRVLDVMINFGEGFWRHGTKEIARQYTLNLDGILGSGKTRDSLPHIRSHWPGIHCVDRDIILLTQLDSPSSRQTLHTGLRCTVGRMHYPTWDT